MIKFFKYNSSGNDFILIDNRLGLFPKKPVFIKELCNRNFGIGADGLILLELANDSNYFMNYFNSDGLESSFCGNGSMCCAHFASTLDLLNESLIGFKGCFSTREGIFDININHDEVCVSMPNVSDFSVNTDSIIINTGSPHYVVVKSKLSDVDMYQEGAAIRYGSEFYQNGINVTFVEKISDTILIRTYERGVESETLSCGTGVVAGVLSLFLQKLISKNKIIVQTQGGTLTVSYKHNAKSNTFSNITLSNNVSRVFEGKITMPKF